MFFLLLTAGFATSRTLCSSAAERSNARQTVLRAHGSDASSLARKIDEQIRAQWQAKGVVPAAKADDAEFLRRVTLDLCGKIPSSWEVREFIEHQSDDRRERIIDQLMEAPAFATFQASRWRKWLLPEADNDLNVRAVGAQLEAWLRTALLKKNTAAQIATELLAAPIPRANPGSQGGEVGGRSNPLAYYQGKDGKPENLAASVARVFLGMRIECAQCHDHPFDSWKQEQFWELAAFFGGIRRQEGNGLFSTLAEVGGTHELKIPGTQQKVGPRFPEGSAAEITDRENSRAALARWMTAKDNRYFSPAIANRLWAQFFGTGLVDPPDDFRADNRPSHPELLQLLAAEFTAHNFDLRYLMRAIALSDTYQLTSSISDPSQQDPRLFAAARLRRISGEQLFASLAQAIGYSPDASREGGAPNQAPTVGGAFLEMFAESGDAASDAATSIVQALTLMNGDIAAQATSLEKSQTLAAIADLPGITAQDEIEALYLASLSRPPRPEEMQKLLPYVEGAKDRRRALSDIFWALLNTTEFQSNH